MLDDISLKSVKVRKKDARKVLNLEYNVLNLLSEVRDASNTTKAKYTYAADGVKLAVRDGIDAGADGYDYLGSFIYKANGDLESVAIADGRIVRGANGTFTTNYFINDHLGSVRVIVDAGGNILGQNDYYPFGGRHENSTLQVNTNRFKFNGKEEQTTGDLGYLDYGARMYDTEIGRWFGVDPLSEKHYNLSSFVYCNNNPIVYIDPDGMDWFYNQYTGEVYYNSFLWEDEVSSIYTYAGGFEGDWVYLGANGMFAGIEGINGEGTLSDLNAMLFAFGAKQYDKDTGMRLNGLFSADKAQFFMDKMGYRLAPASALVYESEIIHPMSTGSYSVSYVCGKIISVVYSYCYIPKNYNDYKATKTYHISNSFIYQPPYGLGLKNVYDVNYKYLNNNYNKLLMLKSHVVDNRNPVVFDKQSPYTKGYNKDIDKYFKKSK